jgi:tetratricopeptide (TPR) repeat protein
MKLIRVVIPVLLAGMLLAQQPPLPGAPSATKTAAKPADYSQEPYVVESQRTAWRFDNDGTGRREVTARILVQSEAGVEQLGQLIIGYNSANESVAIPYVRVRKPDGILITAPETAVQDLTAPVAREAPVYTDYRQKHVSVPGLRPGDTLEYQFLISITTPLAPGQFWMEHDFYKTNIILDDQLEVNLPKGRPLKLKTEPGYDPRISEEDGRRIYRWTSSHKQRDDDDADKKKTRRRKPKPATPDVQLTTFASWDQVGRWYAGLERDRRAPSPEVRARAEQLTNGRATELEKLQAIYDYVAKNFRYVSLSFGLGRYQPHSAAEVLANQYGDCKDKHTLLAGLLEAVGLHASSVLINSSRKLDPDVPSPSQFDHVITMVPLGKDNVWLDTTTEIAPFRLLTYNLRKKQALVIAPDGSASLVETPADAPLPNTQVMEFEGKISELGKLTGHARLAFTGDSELPLRMGFRQIPNTRWKDLAQTVAYLQGLRGDVSNVKADNPADNAGPYHLEFDLSQPNFLDWSSRKSQLTLPMARLRLPELEDTDEAPDPMEIGAPGALTTRLKLELPPNFTARVPLPFAMARDYAEYRAGYRLEGATFTGERTLNLRWRDLPKARVRDYAAFRRAVIADEAQELTLESARQGTPKPPENVKADELYEAGISAFQAQNYRAAAELLQRVTELEPKHKAAWNDLGRAYLALRQIDDAIAALNRQIEINPFDEFAYNNLGRAFWEKRDYPRAAHAFNHQIKVNPLDKFAHRNLGAMYLEQHKNRDALPELEKAASLTPDDAYTLISLGQAQLELDDTEKALASFDRAVNLAPSPGVWNNIAYQLSLKQVHLERAQQYAESAVASTAATLRNLTPDRMQLEQQALVVSLAAQWDTLGWVYFQRGNLDKAEEFVRAAWVVGQHGEVGDHLAQIYEKRGLKDKAIQTYAQALAAYKPLPETRGRLAALVGEKKVDPLVQAAKRELADMTSVKLASPLKDTKEPVQADFYVVIGPGAKVEDVRFISGSDKLKAMSDALRAASFNIIFPEGAPTRLLRRGTLSCSAECVFALAPADDITGGQ